MPRDCTSAVGAPLIPQEYTSLSRGRYKFTETPRNSVLSSVFLIRYIEPPLGEGPLRSCDCRGFASIQ